MSLDQQINEIIESATRQLSGQLGERLRALATEIGQVAATERVSAVREVRLAAESEIAKRSQEAVAAVQADHSRRLEEAVAAARLEGARRVDEAAAAARADHARRVDEAVSAAKAEMVRDRESALASARADLARRIEDAVSLASAELARRHDAALVQVHADDGRRIESAMAAARAEASRDNEAILTRRLDEAVAAARVEAARSHEAALASVRAEADRRQALAVETARHEAVQQTEHSLIEARAAERQAELAQLDRLADAMRRLDAARSLTDVLGVLGDVVAREAPRAAIFLVRGRRFVGWHAAGFDAGIDVRKMEIGADQPGLLMQAVRTGGPVNTSSVDAGHTVPVPFGLLPADRMGLAVPVRVGGESVAVVYADDASPGRHEVPSPWPEVLDVLTRHAARCLEVLTVTRSAHPTITIPDTAPSPRYAPHTRTIQATGSEDDDAARRYARLLVSEIKLYHEAAVTQGRRDRNLGDRLRPEIDRARRLYEERVPAPIRSKMDFFGQELVRTLANGDATLLGAL